MIKEKSKYCWKCCKNTNHKYLGKELDLWLAFWLPVAYMKAWKCEVCGKIKEE